jgi:hypothetical protein
MTPYRSQAAKKNLQKGLEKMEEKLTEAQRIWRSIAAGRPAAIQPDPVSILRPSLDLLRKLKRSLSGVPYAKLKSSSIVFTTADMTSACPAEVVPFSEDKPYEVLKFLMLTKSPAHVLGVLFMVQEGEDQRLFAYPFDRTDQGLAKFEWAKEQRQSRKGYRSMN